MSARLVVEELDVRPTVAAATLALRGDEHPVALAGAWAGGGAVLASEPVRVATAADDPFALLDEQPAVDPDAGDGHAVGGGWFGMLGFALAWTVEALPPPPAASTGLAPFALAFYDHVLRRTPAGVWRFEALWTPERAEALAARRDELARRLASPAEERPFAAGPFTPAPPGAAGLRAAVAECVERIAAGELFQANLALRLEGPFAGDPLDAFAAALAVEPRYGAFLAGPWGATIGLSPELFLRRRGREVTTRPIKGTARRDAASPAGAVAARDALAASPKDRAENVMIVDLMRNDLGRVCAYGSVEADPQPVAEAHPGVWHLVSEVRGRLRDGVGDGELLRATFPPGSVTGAPKVQALRVIAELEGSARHAYTGAIGFASPVAGLELDVAIRTFEVRDGVAWLGAGGGIVADSEPDAEVREALGKAAPLVAAIGAELGGDARRPGRRPPTRALAGGLERPDPRAGIIETIAVRDGTLVALDAHLARLTASVAAVFGAALPDDLATRARDAAARRRGGDARLRIDVVPAGAPGRVRVSLAVADAGARQGAGAALAPVLLPGGLGPHKWRDRRLIDALTERLGAMPLFVDADGAVLEAGTSNVWLVEGHGIVTPPADGRLLPGVTRARALALPYAREERIGLDRLEAADAVVLTSSVALVRPVTNLGAGTVAPERLAALATALRGGLPQGREPARAR